MVPEKTQSASTASTAEISESCISLLRKCLSVASLQRREAFQNRLADLRLWANGVGALANGKASLDERLKFQPDDLIIVVGVLRILESVLEQCHELLTQDKPVDETLTSIDASIENLALLAVAIRKTGKRYRVQKAERRFDPSEHEGLKRHLELIVKIRLSHDYENSDLGDLERMDLSPIQHRLIEANLRRRDMFLRAQKHAIHLGTYVDIGTRTQSAFAEKVSGTSQSRTYDTKYIGKNIKQQGHMEMSRADHELQTVTTASIPEGNLIVPHEKPHLQSQETAKTTITRITATMQYPKPHIPNPEQHLFQCPCCCQSLPADDGRNEIKWRKHLGEDLCPYICIADGCPEPHTYFALRSDLERHMEYDHKPKWECPRCCENDSEGSPVYDSMNEIIRHLRDQHKISDVLLPTFVSQASKNTMGIEACPLCDCSGPQDAPELIEHVMEHVHDFSLRSLPWHQEVSKVSHGDSTLVDNWLRNIETDQMIQPGVRLPSNMPDFGSLDDVHTTISATEPYYNSHPYFAEDHSTDPDYSAEFSEGQADKIRCWLQPPDPSTNANQARNLRHEGTGMWLLEHPVFQSWCTGLRRYVWLHGLAGCGKTILSTTVLDHLASNEDRRVISFFFDFSDTRKQTLDGMLRSLAFQLHQSTPTSSRRLDDLFKNHDNGKLQPATKAISDVVCEILATVTGVCVVLDALDESKSRFELLEWMEDVAARPDLGHVQLLCTARPEPEFLVRFDRIMGKESCIPLDRKAVNIDIRTYVEEQLATRREFQEKRLSQELIEQIVTKVESGADGMFIWAACQMNSLAECRSPRMIRDALQHVPKGLEETYHRMLSNIPNRDKDNVIRLFQFLVHTPRPLIVEEAIDILATDTRTQHPGFDKENRVFGENEVLGHCPDLMSIIEVAESVYYPGEEFPQLRLNKQLHLAHFSVKDYLRSLEWFEPFASSVTITKTCLAYLRSVSGSPETIVVDYPFAKLAAEIWTSHAAFSQSSEEVFQASLAFIKEEETFQRLGHLHQVDWQSPGSPAELSRFYYACLWGLTRVAQEFMRGGVDVNAEGGYCNNALQAASFGGHYDVVKLLLDEGADVHKKGGIYGNALQAASHSGHIGVVKLLLEKGADINSQGGKYGNALQAASERGHIDIVKMLVERVATRS